MTTNLWLKPPEMYYLTVLESKSLKTMCLHGHFPFGDRGKNLFLNSSSFGGFWHALACGNVSLCLCPYCFSSGYDDLISFCLFCKDVWWHLQPTDILGSYTHFKVLTLIISAQTIYSFCSYYQPTRVNRFICH